MKQLNPILEQDVQQHLDLDLESVILERNNREVDMFIKKGYKIKKSIWMGLIAS